MNTYDFDKTIYINDSSADFFFYCLKKHPGAVLRIIPHLAVKSVRYLFKSCDFRELKECIFSYLRYIPDIRETVNSFWTDKWQGIGKWYLEKRKDDDIIISASPEFLVKPAGEKLKVEVIATRMDEKTGKMLGLNCHDEEKVRRFKEEHPGGITEEFYSDSDNDIPMAKIAEKAFKVERGRVRPWNFKNKKTL